jgi:hypothetical protein
MFLLFVCVFSVLGVGCWWLGWRTASGRKMIHAMQESPLLGLLVALLVIGLLNSLILIWALATVARLVQQVPDQLQSLLSVDLTDYFEHQASESALLRVHDLYSALVSNVDRLEQIDGQTGAISRSVWDVSTNHEFSIIWSRLRARGYFQPGVPQQHEKLVVDVGAM